MYYDLSKALSYGAYLNFLCGERGCGKTYSITKFVVKQFINKGYEFVYIRRYKSDLAKCLPTFFKELIIHEEFKGHKLETRGNKFIIDDKIAGVGITLSTAQDYKSANFSNVKYIIFDEFLIEDGKKYYLPNEVESFLGLIESIARTRDVKVFLLGNATTRANPYFMYFDITDPYGTDIKTLKDGLILVQYMKNDKYREFKKQTKFGKLVDGTEYSSYAIDNEFRQDNKTFIMHKTGNARCNCVLIYKDISMGVWFDYNEGKIFISENITSNTPVFACTTSDHLPNTMLLTAVKDYTVIKLLIKNYKLGNVYYESLKLKSVFKEIMRLFI